LIRAMGYKIKNKRILVREGRATGEFLYVEPSAGGILLAT